MDEPHPGQQALAHIRHVLEQRPTKDDRELTAALQCLAQFRKDLTHAQRSDACTREDRDRLSYLNAIIAVTMSMHFPIGNPPWGDFAKCEAWLADLVGNEGAGLDAHAVVR